MKNDSNFHCAIYYQIVTRRACYSTTLVSVVLLWWIWIICKLQDKRGQICLSFAHLKAKMLSVQSASSPDPTTGFVSALPMSPTIARKFMPLTSSVW